MYRTNQPKNKCDIVVDEILSMITRGDYKENEKLPPESYFMNYFGMSRVTIRESFKKLSMLGVVDIRQGVGTFVRQVDLGTLMQPLYSAVMINDLNITQIFDARKYVEAGIAELAARHMTVEEHRKLQEMIDRLDLAVRRKDSAEFSALDVTFHEGLAEACGNSIMAAMYRAIKETISKYVSAVNLSPGMIEQSQECHKSIVQALGARDESEARRLMEEHIEVVKKRYLVMVENGEVPAYIK